MVDEQSLKVFSIYNGVQRFFQVLMTGYVGVFFTGIARKHDLQNFLYVCLGLCSCSNLFVWSLVRKLRSSFVYKLEFDTSGRHFVLTKPVGVINRVQEIIIQTKNLKPLIGDKNCLYYDESTGVKLATNNMGTWHNAGLFLYLMK